MTATATASASAWKSPSHGHSQSKSSRPSAAPRGHSVNTSIGQTMPPATSPQNRSVSNMKTMRSPDQGYFGFVVNDDSIPPDSNPGNHTKQNWNYPVSSIESAGPPKHRPNETNPEFELFRRQSDQLHKFNLNGNVAGLRGQSQNSPGSLKSGRETPLSPMTKAKSTVRHEKSTPKPFNGDNPFFNQPRNESPTPLSTNISVADHQHARLSLPASELRAPLTALKNKQRSETVPPQPSGDAPAMVSPQEIAQILDKQSDRVLIFDLRVYQQYSSSRVKGALNLCLPTTLLKRPTFTVQKLADTFTLEQDKKAFATWQECEFIVVYDANSMQSKEAVMPFNVLKKFSSEGWAGRGLVVKGGFLAFSKQVPHLIDQGPVGGTDDSSNKPLSITSPSENGVPVAGGCSMPQTQSAANPFFGNIRQNMDLLDGVGQLTIKRPAGMTGTDEKQLPEWLREASKEMDKGKQVSDKFLEIEKTEQKRMQQALSGEVSYGSPNPDRRNRFQIAGIEKGAKNRYNNIFPYEHSRVKLQGVPPSGCDYVNANNVKATYSHRRYIATQAPTPATFGDFWRVIWEQDVRVIVMLTAEFEGGQVKGDAYWNSGEFGQFKLKKLSERQVSLDRNKTKGKNSSTTRPPMAPRSSTQPHTFGEKMKVEEAKPPTSTETPVATVRHFTLSHSAQPFQPIREITQVHYTQWPDFGAPANPTAILGLIDQVNKYVRQASGMSSRPDAAAPEGERPIVVHCSAGCGRTGTYCTVDSVIDMMKRQQQERQEHLQNEMELDTPDNWVARDDIDLVAKAVTDFRNQRLSMVQNLRQFVLCYESIIQWIVSQEHEDTRAKFLKEGPRRSYQG